MSRQNLIALILSSILALAARAADLQWTPDSVVGLTIELVDQKRYEWMRFVRDGAVLITIGQKQGPLAAPVFQWTLVSGRLRITTDDKKPYEELTLVSRDASKIVARRSSGELITYKIQK